VQISLAEGHLSPHFTVVIVRLKRQVQAIVRGKIADEVAKLHDAFIGEPNFAELRDVPIGDSGGVGIDLERELRERAQPLLWNACGAFGYELLDTFLVGFQTVVQDRTEGCGAIRQPLALETAMPTC